MFLRARSGLSLSLSLSQSFWSLRRIYCLREGKRGAPWDERVGGLSVVWVGGGGRKKGDAMNMWMGSERGGGYDLYIVVWSFVKESVINMVLKHFSVAYAVYLCKNACRKKALKFFFFLCFMNVLPNISLSGPFVLERIE